MRVLLRLTVLSRALLPLLLLGSLSVRAQGEKSAAVALAAEHPALAGLLASHRGWRADAYDTGNSYGVWRVQFYIAGGDELGWADVSPEREQVYAWEASYDFSGEQSLQTQRLLYRFVRQNPEVRALVGDPATLAKWFWYDSWREGWFVHLERGADSLEISIRSRNKGSLRLSDLFIEKIYFPAVLSFADFQEAERSRAISLAFAEPEIAAALRDKPGWTSAANRRGEHLWQVRFLRSEQLLVSAQIDLSADEVRKFEIKR